MSEYRALPSSEQFFQRAAAAEFPEYEPQPPRMPSDAEVDKRRREIHRYLTSSVGAGFLEYTYTLIGKPGIIDQDKQETKYGLYNTVARQRAGQYLAVVGMTHDFDSSHPIWPEVDFQLHQFDEVTSRYHPNRLLLVEGRVGRPQSEPERYWRSIKGGEGAVLADFAKSKGIPIMSIDEPQFAEAHRVAKYLSEKGYGSEAIQEQMFLYYAGRMGAQIHLGHRADHTEDIMHAHIKRLAYNLQLSGTTFEDFEFSYQNLQRIYEETFDRSFEDDVRNDANFILTRIVSPGLPHPDAMTSRISHLVNRERDMYFAKVLWTVWSKRWNAGCFVGSWHVEKLKPLLEQLGEPVDQDPPGLRRSGSGILGMSK